MSDNNGVLQEEIKSMLQTLLEGQQALSSVPQRLTALEDTLNNEVDLLRALWRDHESRITKLETQ